MLKFQGEIFIYVGEISQVQADNMANLWNPNRLIGFSFCVNLYTIGISSSSLDKENSAIQNRRRDSESP